MFLTYTSRQQTGHYKPDCSKWTSSVVIRCSLTEYIYLDSFILSIRSPFIDQPSQRKKQRKSIIRNYTIDFLKVLRPALVNCLMQCVVRSSVAHEYSFYTRFLGEIRVFQYAEVVCILHFYFFAISLISTGWLQHLAAVRLSFSIPSCCSAACRLAKAVCRHGCAQYFSNRSLLPRVRTGRENLMSEY